MRYIVVIPTYNNEGTIAGVISDVAKYAGNILVVNDGSTDSTQHILDSIEGIEVISYVRNRGKGHALKLALSYAAEQGYDYAITIDADGQHYADDLPVFLQRIEQVPDSLLIGARNLQADNMPSKNTFANRFSNFWYKVETGRSLSDTQSGYRLYPVQRLKNMRLITRRYEFELEVMVRAAWRGLNVENVPIKVFYPKAEERVSHFRPFKDFTRITLLNIGLVLGAVLYYYPWRFLKALTWANIRKFIDTQIIHSSDSNARMAAAMGWGVFCGIIPIWGYQMIFAGLSAHFLKLNKVIAIVFSNISVPPLIPFILYGSVYAGALILGTGLRFSLTDISFENLGASLLQYVVGSFVLAAICGALVFSVSWLTMKICRRKARHD